MLWLKHCHPASLLDLTVMSFPCRLVAEAGVPPSTHVEHNAGDARVRYSPTLQEQHAISSQGLNVDFIIQYDVELRDLIGDIQVCTLVLFTFLFFIVFLRVGMKVCMQCQLFICPFVSLALVLSRCTTVTLCITLHLGVFLWFPRTSYLS